jgi:hypothetical protein
MEEYATEFQLLCDENINLKLSLGDKLTTLYME